MNQPSPSDAALHAAQSYEDHFVTERFGPWAEDLLDRARPKPGEVVLDLACGTGIVARKAIQRMNGDGRVAGLDINPAMIEVARACAEREGVEIAWQLGSADALPFPDASFELVLIQQGLQFFPDRIGAAREVHRVLKPGGRVVTATWTEIAGSPVSQIIAEAAQAHLGTAALLTPHSLSDPDELRMIFEDAGFVDIDIERVSRMVRSPFDDQFVDRRITSAAAGVRSLQTMDPREREALIDAMRSDVAEPLRQLLEGDEIVAPTEAHITRAHKAA